MKEARHDESKDDFQLERLCFFTDGVFAIAITLLVIEIKVPGIEAFNDHALLKNLSETLTKFVGFFISFGMIAHYWSVHHRIFGYIRRSTSSLFWLNIGFLFSIVLLPFSSGLVGEYSTHTEMLVPYIFYSINMCICGVMNVWMWLYVSKPSRDLLTRKISLSRIKLGVYRSMVVPFVFLISAILSFWLPILSRLSLLLIPISLHWGMKIMEIRADFDEKNSTTNHH